MVITLQTSPLLNLCLSECKKVKYDYNILPDIPDYHILPDVPDYHILPDVPDDLCLPVRHPQPVPADDRDILCCLSPCGAASSSHRTGNKAIFAQIPRYGEHLLFKKYFVL